MRDRIEYFDIKRERAGEILAALNVRLKTSVEMDSSRELVSA